MENVKNKFGKLIKEARDKKEVSQIECAKGCGVSVVTYQYWERGICIPKEENMKKLCDFLNIDMEDIKCIMEV